MAKAIPGPLAHCISGAQRSGVWRTTADGQVIQISPEAAARYGGGVSGGSSRQNRGRQAFKNANTLLNNAKKVTDEQRDVAIQKAWDDFLYFNFGTVGRKVRAGKKKGQPTAEAKFRGSLITQTKVSRVELEGVGAVESTLRNFTFVPATRKDIPSPDIEVASVAGGVRLSIDGADSYKDYSLVAYWCFAQLDVNPYEEMSDDQLEPVIQITDAETVDLTGLDAGEYVVGAAACFGRSRYPSRLYSASRQTTFIVS